MVIQGSLPPLDRSQQVRGSRTVPPACPAQSRHSARCSDAAVAARIADFRCIGGMQKGEPFGPPTLLLKYLPLGKRCDILQAKFVSFAEHPVHEQTEDAEDGIEAHVRGDRPGDSRASICCFRFDRLDGLSHGT